MFVVFDSYFVVDLALHTPSRFCLALMLMVPAPISKRTNNTFIRARVRKQLDGNTAPQATTTPATGALLPDDHGNVFLRGRLRSFVVTFVFLLLCRYTSATANASGQAHLSTTRLFRQLNVYRACSVFDRSLPRRCHSRRRHHHPHRHRLVCACARVFVCVVLFTLISLQTVEKPAAPSSTL